MSAFHQPVQDDFESVNQLIIDQLHSNVNLVENIGHYIVDAGGKRLRPLLVLLIARALGYSGKQHIDLAAIIEFIHTATLLHDDVVDLSELRRNRLTANAQFGNAPSVLVGDFLYSRAFQMLVRVGVMPIMEIMADATNTIAEGEVLQLVNAGNPDTSEENYYQVIHYKTAKLFEAACQIAATISEVNSNQVECCRLYGFHLGMAFQIMDDILDYSGSSEQLGKNVGDDLAEGKPTLPLIYALRTLETEKQQIIRRAITEKNSKDLGNIITLVQSCGALEYSKKQAQQHVDQALAALNNIPPSNFLTALKELASFSISRTK